MLINQIVTAAGTLRSLSNSPEIAQLILDLTDDLIAVRLLDDTPYRSVHPQAQSFVTWLETVDTVPDSPQTITIDEIETYIIPLHRDGYDDLGMIILDAASDATESFRLLGELVAARLSELQAVQHIRALTNERSIITSLNMLVHSTFDLTQLSQNLYDIIQQIYLPDVLHLSVQSLDTRTIQRVTITSDTTQQSEQPFGYDIHDQVIRQARPILWRDEAERDAVCATLNINPTGLPTSYIGLPLAAKDRIMGTLSCSNADPDVLHESYVQILLTVADSTTLAVENILLLDDTMRRVRDMALLNDISQHLSSAFNDEDLWFLLRETLHDLFEGSLVVIGLGETAHGDMRFLREDSTEWYDQVPDELSQIVMDNAIPLHFRDIAQEETRLREFNVHGSFIRQTTIRSWIGVPLRDESRNVIGVLSVAHNKPAFFTDDSLSILNNLAAQLSLALSNARLLESQQDRTERLITMQRMSALVNSVLDIQEIVTLSAEAMVGLFKVDSVTIVAQSQDKAHPPLITQYPQTSPDPLLEAVVAEQFSSGFLMTQKHNQQVPIIITPDNIRQLLPADSAMYQYIVSNNFDICVIMPMIVKEQLIGWIDLTIHDQKKHRPLDHEALSTVAAQLALAIHNADLYQQAVEGNRLKSEFLASISHELRTPLNAIIGYSDLLLRGTYGTVPEKQLDRLERIRRSGRSLLNLIDDILDLAKLEAGRLEVSFELVDIIALIREAIETVRIQIDTKQLELRKHLADNLPPVQGDSARIRQILNNLLDNAVKFTPEGWVELNVFATDAPHKTLPIPPDPQISSGEWLVIQVSDSGIGIDESNLTSIFEAFRQVDGSQSREYEGTGLGLAITQRLVAMHHGYIWAVSKLNVGSQFYVLLPIQTQ